MKPHNLAGLQTGELNILEGSSERAYKLSSLLTIMCRTYSIKRMMALWYLTVDGSLFIGKVRNTSFNHPQWLIDIEVGNKYPHDYVPNQKYSYTSLAITTPLFKRETMEWLTTDSNMLYAHIESARRQIDYDLKDDRWKTLDISDWQFRNEQIKNILTHGGAEMLLDFDLVMKTFPSYRQ